MASTQYKGVYDFVMQILMHCMLGKKVSLLGMLSDTPERTFNYNYSLIPVAFLALSLSPDDFNDKNKRMNDYT